MKLSKKEKIKEEISVLKSIADSLWRDCNTYHAELIDNVVKRLETIISKKEEN